MYSGRDDSNHERAADEHLAGAHLGDGGDARPVDVQPEDVDDAHREVDSRRVADHACSARLSRSNLPRLPMREAQDQPATLMQAQPASWHLKVDEPSGVLLGLLMQPGPMASATFRSAFGTRACIGPSCCLCRCSQTGRLEMVPGRLAINLIRERIKLATKRQPAAFGSRERTAGMLKCLGKLVGARGFEPPTPSLPD